MEPTAMDRGGASNSSPAGSRRVLGTAAFALSLVAVLAVASFGIEVRVGHDGDGFAHTINIAGRQRMLSQKTTLLAVRVATKPAQADIDELDAALRLMAEAHAILRDGDPSGRALDVPPAEVLRLMDTPPWSIDMRVRQHIGGLRLLLPGLLTDDASARSALQAHVNVAVHSLLPVLDHMVTAYEHAAEARDLRLHWIHAGLTLAMLTLLVASYVALFRPMAINVARDFRRVRQARDELESALLTDELTGIGNRKALMTTLGDVVDGPMAALQIDLDHFKSVNDLLGHEMGDRVLVEVARAMRLVAGPGDRIFRLAGDEFVLVQTERISVDRAAATAERLIAAIDERCPAEAVQAGLAASVGVAVHPDGESDRPCLLANADIALYEAKALGRHRYCVFLPQMRAPIEARSSVERAFRSGLAAERVVLHFQPQLDLSSGQLLGLEALVRWRGQDGELIYPDRFLPFIEGTPLIVELTDQVVAGVIAVQLRLAAAGLAALPIGVNIADLQLRDGAFAADLLSALAGAGLGPEAIAVEIVERALVGRGQEQVQTQLHRLARAGIMIELDDFGTGHASLTHLKTFPVGRIKLDRSFVAGIGIDEGDETIVRATIDIARSFGRRVIAEGIETEAQHRFLVDAGCREGQGYRFAAPMPERLLLRWLRNRRPVEAMDVA